MGSQLIYITNQPRGVLADADSLPVLSDAGNAYGVKLTLSPGTVIVAAGTAMTRQSLGVYVYTVTGLTDNTSYTYAAKVINGGVTDQVGPRAFTFNSTATVPTSVFFTYSDFVKRWGQRAITEAANKDGPPIGQTVDYPAIQLAFDWATDEIFGNLYGGVLAVPLDFTPNSGQVPSRIADKAMVLAFWRLAFDMRKHDTTAGKVKAGMRDNVQAQMADVYHWLSMVKGGTLQVPEAVYSTNGNNQGTTAVSNRRSRWPLDASPTWPYGYCWP